MRALPRRVGGGLEAVERDVAGKDRRQPSAARLHQRNDVIGRCLEPGSKRRIEVRLQLLAHRPAMRACPDRAVHWRIDLAEVDDARRDHGSILGTLVAAAAPLALAAIEIGRMLAARHEHPRADRLGADHARVGGTTGVADRAFMRGRVPGLGDPPECGRIETRCGDDRRDVLGVEMVGESSAVVRPQMKVVQLDRRAAVGAANAKRLAV